MKNTRCNLCDSIEKSAYLIVDRYGEQFTYVKCKNCGLIYLYPAPSEKELKKYYLNEYDYDCFIKNKKGVIKRSRKELNIINKLTKKGKILDIGCGHGFFLETAKENGWETYGLDISKKAIQYAKNVLNLSVFHGELKDCDCKKESFDAITMWHVLEHTQDPKKTLKLVNGLLKKGGLLAVKVPNIDSLMAKIGSKRWGWLAPPEHLFHFSPKTIKKMLEETGFEILDLKTRQGDLKYLSSWFHLPRSIKPLFNSILIMIYYLLFPLVYIIWLTKMGEEIQVYAKKFQD